MKDEEAVRSVLGGEERVPLLGAEMGDVDARGRVVGQHPQHAARRQRLQPLARLQHRQRAEQPACVELGIGFGRCVHAALIPRLGAALKAAGALATAASLAAPAAADPRPYVIEDAAAIPASLTGAPGDPARGAALYAREALGCAACHGPLGGPAPEGAAPALAPGMEPGRARLWVVAPRAIDPETAMPAFYAAGQRTGADDPRYGEPLLTAAEVEDLVAYLAAAPAPD